MLSSPAVTCSLTLNQKDFPTQDALLPIESYRSSYAGNQNKPFYYSVLKTNFLDVTQLGMLPL